MARFIFVTFVFMAWVFYEMSGGSEFDPVETRLARIDMPAVVEEKALDAVVAAAPLVSNSDDVTRVSLNLTSVNDVLRPAPTLRTKRAKETPPLEEDIVEAISEEPPVIVLPSLIENAAVITPVDFGSDPAPVATVPSDRDVRAVTGNRVNVRGGPGTDYSVVNKLVRGDEVEILQNPGNGWVKLRPLNGTAVGWMADFLLSEG